MLCIYSCDCIETNVKIKSFCDICVCEIPINARDLQHNPTRLFVLIISNIIKRCDVRRSSIELAGKTNNLTGIQISSETLARKQVYC